ncbi:YbaK/EbsC family protein [Actinocorallia sp. A-T 12471]|uniref:YbaK/EbsC family protein n=1 Tax=Actinocorallia sp. A-T 12471 TaxID=3089813 RepID=UPI0029CB22C5|nr:YbaK/EbsC family protein [Actinocorallia sp. A-T 12471]MDX6743151.1 YbaK/EbsC family protein [Actinocorallia sp. A-T 12471]
MHPNTAHVAAVLASFGAVGEVVELDEAAPTAQAAADLLRCAIGAIANSLVFDADGTPLLVLTSGAHRVDVKKVAALVGAAKVKRATPEFVRDATGQPIGGVSPVGHPAPIRTLVDVALEQYDTVWAAAGHPHTVFPTNYTELLKLTAGTPAEVA